MEYYLWYSHQESNLDLSIRSALFYPLNYRSVLYYSVFSRFSIPL